jgi:hypothetical protein
MRSMIVASQPAPPVISLVCKIHLSEYMPVNTTENVFCDHGDELQLPSRHAVHISL